jgi:hypothetical protein
MVAIRPLTGTISPSLTGDKAAHYALFGVFAERTSTHGHTHWRWKKSSD